MTTTDDLLGGPPDTPDSGQVAVQAPPAGRGRTTDDLLGLSGPPATPPSRTTDDLLTASPRVTSTDDLLGGGTLIPSFARDETADVPSAASPVAGKSLHGMVATGLLAPYTKTIQNVGTALGVPTGESRPWAIANLAALAAGPVVSRIAGLGLEGAGVASELATPIAHAAVGAAQGATSAPESPIVGGLIGAGLGALTGSDEGEPTAAGGATAAEASTAAGTTAAPRTTDDALGLTAPPAPSTAGAESRAPATTDDLLPATAPTAAAEARPPLGQQGYSGPIHDDIPVRLPAAAPVQPGPAFEDIPQPPITEIDYTGDKPVVVNAAPGTPAPAPASTRAPRQAKIDTSIPGREKMSAHDQTYAGMPVSDLLDELHTQYGALDVASSNPAAGGWTRFDDDEQIMRSGSGLGAAIARQQQKFALQRVTAIERELTRRGVGPDEMAEQMQLRRDRALERPLDDDEDADLSFPGSPMETGAPVPAVPVPGGSDVGDDQFGVASPVGTADRGGAGRGPLDLGAGLDVREGAQRPGDAAPGALGALDAAGGVGVAAVRTPALADVPLRSDAPLGVSDPRLPLRLDKFDVDESGRTDLAAELTRLDQAGQLDRSPVSFATMRGQAMDFAKSIGADPLSVDLSKVRTLSGPEIVGLKNVVSRNTDEITTASKLLADPAIDPATQATLSARLDALRAQRENLLGTIITNTSQRARDLGFLRQISTRTLDPDVWEIQARRVANRPLSDTEAANIRGLARTAAGICGGMAAD